MQRAAVVASFLAFAIVGCADDGSSADADGDSSAAFRLALLDDNPERRDEYEPPLESLDAACTQGQDGIANGVTTIHDELVDRTGEDRPHLTILNDLVGVVESARTAEGTLIEDCPTLFAFYLTTESG